MLRPLYKLIGAAVLGLVSILALALAWPIILVVFVCVCIGFAILESFGVKDAMPGLPAAADKAVYHTGRCVVLLLFSPVLIPLWMLKTLYGTIREAKQRVRSRSEQAAAENFSAHQSAEEQLDAERMRQRDDILLSCEMLYNTTAPKLNGRFSREDLDRFVTRFMGESEPTDVLRRRSQELIKLIRQHAEVIEHPEKRSSLESLTDWYSEQKTEIESLPLDESFKQDFLVQLNERYAELCQQTLEQARL